MEPIGPQFGPPQPFWGDLLSMDTAGPVAAPPASHFPLPGWPAMTTVEYLTKLILLGLLLLALPYLIGSLILKPEAVLTGAANRAMHVS